MRTFIIGAGASKAYSSSPTNCTMPIANDFFNTFQNLDISNDLWVLIGDIINIGKQDFDIVQKTLTFEHRFQKHLNSVYTFI